MKPISVRFKCFGPYVDEQYIDFRDLEKGGLFLICGETGAGKTTILDAMCYALYGQSSGGARGKLQEMRCKRADPAQETFVEYIFSSGENTYQFYRGIRPRKQRKSSLEAGRAQAFNEEYQCRILRDGEFVPMSDTKAIQSYMDKKAEEILGLRYEQFKQVIILPQGQFEKLLTSDSDEKEKILVKLFRADKYDRVSRILVDRLAEEEKALRLQRALLEEKLRRYGCTDLEGLDQLIAQTTREAGELEEQYRSLEGEIRTKKDALDQARKDDQDFADLEKAEKHLDGLCRQQPQMDARREKLDQARAADLAAPAYGDYQLCRKNARKAEKTLEERKAMLESARRRTESLQQEKQAHEEHRRTYEDQKRRKVLLESLEDLYRSLGEKESACRNARKEAAKADRSLEEAAAGLDRADGLLKTAIEKQREAENAFHRGNDLYLGSIGAILAESLQEGEKCPVCGSCHHPEPARHGETRISEKELEALNKANRKALKDLEAVTKDREKAAEQKQQAELAAAAWQKEAENAEALWQEALSRRAEGVETDRQRLEVLKTLDRDIEAFRDADLSMQDRINAADSDLRTQQQRREDAAGEAEAADLALTAAREAWEQAAAQAGFSGEQDYLAARMEPDRQQALQVQVIQFATDLENAGKDIAEKRAALGDRVRPDVAGAEASLTEAENRKETVSNQLGLRKKALEDQQKDRASLGKDLPGWEKQDQRNKANMEFARRLRGDNSISLQRYVLGVMLTSITNAANRLLKTVYGGRYQLYRTNEASNGKQKRGLALVVADQDGQRSVNSLSGGEKFLLSLSLGIGLATVVQAQGNGIRLEAMFIDEGFGSLDEKSIDDAMEILETVRSSSGIVGIISHVERLAETIPAKIQITKTKNGSQCRVTC